MVARCPTDGVRGARPVHIAAVAFLLGTLSLLWLPALPVLAPAATALLVIAAVLALGVSHTRALGFAVLGFLHALIAAEAVLEARLPRALEGRPLDVVGVVVALPASDPRRVRFRLRVEQVNDPAGKPIAWGDGALLRLSWYARRGAEPPALGGGERLSLRVKLRRPRGLANAAGFDYERWLFTERIAATGYVIAARAPAVDAQGGVLLAVRAALAARVREAAAEVPRRAMLVALTLGERSGLDGREWELLRATGTGHLVAISGLHVGMLALLAFVVVRRAWVLWPALPRLLAAPRAAAIGALLVAACYAALAGFTLPTQRALVMVAVAMLALVARRSVAPGDALAAALLLVVLLDPLAGLAAGFWLSFAATAVLLHVVTGRCIRASRPWSRVLLLQLAVGLGLAPVALGVFGFQPLLAPLANLLAIPWTAWLIVPLSLLGAVFAALAPDLAVLPLWLAGHAADVLFAGLSALVEFGGDWRLWREPSLAAVAAAMVGTTLLLLPRGATFRWIGLLWLAPLLLTSPAVRAPGEVEVAVLDVGQGLSVLVTTTRHALLYDTGPSYPGGFDSGRAVILPYLRVRGIERLDVLLLSHANADHTGGADAVLAGIPVGKVLHNAPRRGTHTEACVRGQGWVWDGIEFDLLHPSASAGEVTVDNNGSCVLRVRGPGGSVLLPADLESAGEATLLASGADIDVTMLVVGHHGSRTSSSAAFIDATRPRLAVFSTGYRNRYGFPVAEVAARLRAAGARLLDTATDGAVLVRLTADGAAPTVRRLREQRRAIWREP